MVRGTILLLSLLLTTASGAAAAPDVETIVEESRRVQDADNAVWAELAFRRHVTRQRLGADGEVEWRQEMHFQVTPTAAGIDEELLEIDGRAPSAREVKQHRKAGRHVKHFQKISSGELRNPFGEDIELQPLIFDQEHRYVDQEEVEGVPCHRVEFDARPESEGLPTAEQLKRAAKGRACLSVDGLHLVEAEVETVRQVKKGPATLRHLRFHLEYRPGGEAWLPRLIEMRTELKIPGRSPRSWNFYRYSDYRRPAGE